jgi:hypothetical protein
VDAPGPIAVGPKTRRLRDFLPLRLAPESRCAVFHQVRAVSKELGCSLLYAIRLLKEAESTGVRSPGKVRRSFRFGGVRLVCN